MKSDFILLFDALINFILAMILLAFSTEVSSFFGIPPAQSAFYPNILGGVFMGITLALIFEVFRNGQGDMVGLGLIGALSINLCGGFVLLIWLIFGDLDLPVKGSILLWTLDAVLLVLSYLSISEEKRLGMDFGNEYEDYKKTVPMFFPKIRK